MISAEKLRYANNPVRLKPIALPVEHGGWGLLLEPVALGLLVAPSVSGFFVALAAVGAFLTRQPFKLLVGDLRRGRRLPRTPAALQFVLLYVLLSAVCLIAAAATARNSFLLPLLLAAPLAGVQLLYDSLGKTRALIPELAGSLALGAVAASIALAQSGNWKVAYGLWLVMAARSLPTILYLRSRLAISHKQPVTIFPALAANLTAPVVLFALADRGFLPFLAVVAITGLTIRAIVGLCSSEAVAAKRLGIQEFLFGAGTVLLSALGYWLHY
ncbi:MAG TPA: YwiC-like family protein [Pyrinomonadaceae bacterium]|nr:YwiC-like family protein [Pyrinomonadaceae bacterium]